MYLHTCMHAHMLTHVCMLFHTYIYIVVCYLSPSSGCSARHIYTIYIHYIYIHLYVVQGFPLQGKVPVAFCTLRCNVVEFGKSVLHQLSYLGLLQLLVLLVLLAQSFNYLCCSCAVSLTYIYRLPFPYKDVA